MPRHSGVTTKRLFSVFAIAAILMITLQIAFVAEANVAVAAGTGGFGAAFGYAQTIAGFSFTQAGSIGNGFGQAGAIIGGSTAFSGVFSQGAAAAFAQSIGTPFGSAAQVQVASLGGNAFGSALAFP